VVLRSRRPADRGVLLGASEPADDPQRAAAADRPELLEVPCEVHGALAVRRGRAAQLGPCEVRGWTPGSHDG
jgi:hypothetical protein